MYIRTHPRICLHGCRCLFDVMFVSVETFDVSEGERHHRGMEVQRDLHGEGPNLPIPKIDQQLL